MAEPESLKAAIAAWEKEAEKSATKPRKMNCRASLKNTEVKGEEAWFKASLKSSLLKLLLFFSRTGLKSPYVL